MYQRLARTNCKRAPELCHFAEILVKFSLGKYFFDFENT
jgi:hypothetical protein